MASKLAFKALVILFVLGSHHLGQAVPLRGAVGHDPKEMTGGSPRVGSKQHITTASVEDTPGEDDEKVVAILLRFVAWFITTHFPTYIVPPTCIPTIAKHCGRNISLQCLKEALSKCKKQGA